MSDLQVRVYVLLCCRPDLWIIDSHYIAHPMLQLRMSKKIAQLTKVSQASVWPQAELTSMGMSIAKNKN